MAVDRKKVKKYFQATSKTSYYLLIGGIVGLFLFSSVTILLIASLIAAGFGAWQIYDTQFNKPTDEQMDAWLDEDLTRLLPDALKKAGVDISELEGQGKPVKIYGTRLESAGGAEFYYKKGKDKKPRYSPVDSNVILFTEHQLISYQCAIDLTTGNSLNQNVKRFFYKDVVSAETESEDITVDVKNISNKVLQMYPEAKKYIVNGKLQINDSETFRLTTSAGTAVKIRLSIPTFIESNQSDLDLSDRLADEAIRSVNKMLISKKV